MTENVEVIVAVLSELNLRLNSNGELRLPNSRRAFSYRDFLTDHWDDPDYTPSQNEFNDAVEAYKQLLLDAVSEVEPDTQKYILDWLNRQGYGFSADDSLIKRTKFCELPVSIGELCNDLFLEIKAENRRRSSMENAVKLEATKEYIMAALSVYVKKHLDEKKLDILKSLTYDPSTGFDLDGWVRSILSIYGVKKHFEENVLMFKHALWAMKRGLYYKPVDYRFLYVIYSPIQGIGKTTLIANLNVLWPSRYSEDFDLAKINDDKNFKAMVRDIVSGDFQELANVQDTHETILKRVITQKKVSGRVLYGHSNETENIYTTFFASSNLTVSEALYDATGMRRYWQISMEPENRRPFNDLEGHLDVDTLTMLYRSIDENDSRGFYDPDNETLKPIIESIQDIQDKYIAMEDKLSLYLKHSYQEIYAGDSEDSNAIIKDGYRELKLDTFRKNFVNWQKRNGYAGWNLSTLKKVLKNRFYVITEKDDPVSQKYYEVIYIRGRK